MKIVTFIFAVANATLKEDTKQWLLDNWWESATETFNFASTGFFWVNWSTSTSRHFLSEKKSDYNSLQQALLNNSY